MRRLDQINLQDEIQQVGFIQTALDEFHVPGERADRLIHLLAREMLFDSLVGKKTWEPHQVANRYYELLAMMTPKNCN